MVPQRTVMWPEPFASYEDTWHYMPPAGDGHGEYRVPDLPNVTKGKPPMKW